MLEVLYDTEDDRLDISAFLPSLIPSSVPPQLSQTTRIVVVYPVLPRISSNPVLPVISKYLSLEHPLHESD